MASNKKDVSKNILGTAKEGGNKEEAAKSVDEPADNASENSPNDSDQDNSTQETPNDDWVTMIWRPLAKKLVHERSSKPTLYSYHKNNPKSLDPLTQNELYIFSKYPGLLEKESENVLQVPFSLKNIEHSNMLMDIYTGIPLVKGFHKLEEIILKVKNNEIRDVSLRDQLFLTLMKLKLNPDDLHLSERFKCSIETIETIIKTWAYAIHEFLNQLLTCNLFARTWNPWKQRNDGVNIIIDDMPVYLNGIRKRTVIACTMDGMIVYSSNLYLWDDHYKYIVEDSGLLDKLIPEDNLIYIRDVSLEDQVKEGIFEMPDTIRYGLILDKAKMHLMDYRILMSIPESLKDVCDDIWKACVVLSTYSRNKNLMN